MIKSSMLRLALPQLAACVLFGMAGCSSTPRPARVASAQIGAPPSEQAVRTFAQAFVEEHYLQPDRARIAISDTRRGYLDGGGGHSLIGWITPIQIKGVDTRGYYTAWESHEFLWLAGDNLVGARVGLLTPGLGQQFRTELHNNLSDIQDALDRGLDVIDDPMAWMPAYGQSPQEK